MWDSGNSMSTKRVCARTEALHLTVQLWGRAHEATNQTRHLPRPLSPLPALLLTQVRFLMLGFSLMALISVSGVPHRPKPELRTVEPDLMSLTASAGVVTLEGRASAGAAVARRRTESGWGRTRRAAGARRRSGRNMMSGEVRLRVTDRKEGIEKGQSGGAGTQLGLPAKMVAFVCLDRKQGHFDVGVTRRASPSRLPRTSPRRPRPIPPSIYPEHLRRPQHGPQSRICQDSLRRCHWR